MSQTISPTISPRRALLLHAVHVVTAVSGLVVAHTFLDGVVGFVVVGACSFLAYISCFTLFHDASHGSLGLSAQGHSVVTGVAALPLLFSGHAQRQLHLRHHARPLADDDVEGQGARRSFFGALFSGPLLVAAMVVEGLRAVPPRLKAVVVAEWIGALSIAVALVWAGYGVFVLVDVVLLLTMGVWASHLPHHTPPWLSKVAGVLVWTRHPVLLSLLFHDEHHRRPKVPCAALGPA